MFGIKFDNYFKSGSFYIAFIEHMAVGKTLLDYTICLLLMTTKLITRKYMSTLKKNMQALILGQKDI